MAAAVNVSNYLYLLEFLVDDVNLAAEGKLDENTLSGETCVHFQFLNNTPLQVCEADFTPVRNEFSSDGAVFKSGKSCLFALSPDQSTEAIKDFKIDVTVLKQVPRGGDTANSEKVTVGTTFIPITNEFNEILMAIEMNPAKPPPGKIIKQLFQIHNEANENVGDITAFVRLSCFGSVIVTQFQMNMEDKTVLFKDNQGRSMYKYKKSKKPGEEDKETGKGAGGAKVEEPPDDRCYQEIGAELNGNALVIRVIKDKKKDDSDDCCVCGAPAKNGENGGSKQAYINTNINMPPGASGNKPPEMSFRVDGCPGGAGGGKGKKAAASGPQQCIRCVPPHENADGMQEAEISDFNRDVFVLKIGKKADGEDKKNNLELELRTPKAPIRKPPVKYQSVDTQYSADDCKGNGDAGGKKGKGKKGKK